MNPTTIMTQAMADGVTLSLSATGSIKAAGDSAAVNRWLPVIREHKAGIIDVLKVGANDIATASRAWSIRYLDGDPLQVICVPDMTHATILAAYSGAVAVEPFLPNVREPSNPMSAIEESAIRDWLGLIEETDPETIAVVLKQCRIDMDARTYFIGRATGNRWLVF